MPVEFEARIEFQTTKAYLIEPTIGPRVEEEKIWLPISQVVTRTDEDDDGNVIWTVTDWWAKKQWWLE